MIAWPPCSRDLNLYDFWLWMFLKDHAYRGSIRTIPELKKSITTRHVTSTDREILRATFKHTITRFVTESHGLHIEQRCE